MLRIMELIDRYFIVEITENNIPANIIIIIFTRFLFSINAIVDENANVKGRRREGEPCANIIETPKIIIIKDKIGYVIENRAIETAMQQSMKIVR